MGFANSKLENWFDSNRLWITPFTNHQCNTKNHVFSWHIFSSICYTFAVNFHESFTTVCKNHDLPTNIPHVNVWVRLVNKYHLSACTCQSMHNLDKKFVRRVDGPNKTCFSVYILKFLCCMRCAKQRTVTVGQRKQSISVKSMIVTHPGDPKCQNILQ